MRLPWLACATMVALSHAPVVRAQVDAGPEDPFAPLDDYCAHRVECDTSGATTTEACLADAPRLQRIADVEHEDCQALLQAILARYACEAGLPCDELDNPDNATCVNATNRVTELVLTGADACFSGHVPVDVPPTWTCNAFYYAGGEDDGCDCGCGAVDPDCGEGGGCAESGCFQAACEYCYTDNTDIGCEEPGEGEGEGEGEGDTQLPPPGSCACAGGDSPATAGLWLASLIVVGRGLRRRRR